MLGEIFAPNQNGWFVKLQSISKRNKKWLTVIAVNILTTTPTPKLIAKPFTGPEPKIVKIPAVIITDTFASVIVANARLKPASIATRMDLPENTSSLKRSKIRMFASTATPIDKIIPAIPGNVIVALKPLPNTSNKSITYTSNAILATIPEKRYKITKKIMIIAIPALKATTDLSLES